jgi:hypothetical protein
MVERGYRRAARFTAAAVGAAYHALAQEFVAGGRRCVWKQAG